jgi:hypothetical protein
LAIGLVLVVVLVLDSGEFDDDDEDDALWPRSVRGRKQRQTFHVFDRS